MRHQFISEEAFKVIQERVRGNSNCNRNDGACVGATGVTAVPRVNPSRSSPYKSKWEASYAAKLEREVQCGLLKFWAYEPFSLWLPGKVRYKPDFLIQYNCVDTHPIELIEIKGWSKNRRDGITRLKIAAALFPCFVWRMVYRTKGGGWDGEYV